MIGDWEADYRAWLAEVLSKYGAEQDRLFAAFVAHSDQHIAELRQLVREFEASPGQITDVAWLTSGIARLHDRDAAFWDAQDEIAKEVFAS